MVKIAACNIYWYPYKMIVVELPIVNIEIRVEDEEGFRRFIAAEYI